MAVNARRFLCDKLLDAPRPAVPVKETCAAYAKAVGRIDDLEHVAGELGLAGKRRNPSPVQTARRRIHSMEPR